MESDFPYWTSSLSPTASLMILQPIMNWQVASYIRTHGLGSMVSRSACNGPSHDRSTITIALFTGREFGGGSAVVCGGVEGGRRWLC